MSWQRVFIIVLDSVGIGELPDAADYQDEGANTLAQIAKVVGGLKLPNLERLGLGNIANIEGVSAVEKPLAFYGKMAELSVGKDTMTGHWELMGLLIKKAFHTYPQGFPADLIEAIEQRTGRHIVGNKPASGTEILDELGEHQMQTGDWIVYTSADSVLQIAAHEAIIPLEELYVACEYARELTFEQRWSVGRVIARPYVGQPGAFTRTANRHDYAVPPPQPTLLDALCEAGLNTISIGKINDIFSGQGIQSSYPTKSNDHGINELLAVAKTDFRGLCFANLVDFDSLYGHRRDPHGYATALQHFDRRLPELLEQLGEKDLLIITADHGNDPTHHGTDHTREYVPILIYDGNENRLCGYPIGTRRTFADLSATIAELFAIPFKTHGQSFLQLIQRGDREEIE
jgi:phosphopentomutase